MIFYIYFLSLDGNVLTDPLLQIEIGGLTIERGVEVTIEGIQTVGTWNQTEEGANWPTHPHVAVAGFKNKDGDSSFNNNNNNKTLIVRSIFVRLIFYEFQHSNEWLIHLWKTEQSLLQDERIQWFVLFLCIITDEITKMRLGFHYKLKKTTKFVEDSSYGSLDEETGEWNSPHRCKHTSSSRSSSRRRMLRSGFSVRDPSQPHFELVNNISSLIQQGSDVITKYSGFVSKLQQNKYQFHLLFHYRGTWTRDRRLAGMLVRSFTFDHDLLVATLPVTLGRLFFFLSWQTVGLMDSLIKLSWKTWPPSRRKSNTAASDQDQPSHSSVYASHFF